ncbi:CapA family protein [Blautia sp. HCP3S3_H10_1]|uniref:CapA family protein n=1 Tax=unclassified Blautia TaxID=2648079 RepID=UPI003F8DE358|nr:CapA family protein [Clostridia bacterium]
MKKRDNLPLNYKERLNSRTSFLVSIAVLIVLCLVFNQMDYAMIRQPAAQAKKAADAQKQKEEEAAVSAPEVTTATVLAVGDNLVQPSLLASGQSDTGAWNYDSVYTNLKADIQAADVAIVNQETPFTADHNAVSGTAPYATPTEIGDALVNAGFNVVTSATSLIDDNGASMITETLNYWKTSHPDVTLAGIHESQTGTDAPKIVEINGIKIAILNYTFPAYGSQTDSSSDSSEDGTEDSAVASDSTGGTTTSSATASSKGSMIDTFNTTDVAAAVKQAKSSADCVIFCANWGKTEEPMPTEYEKEWANFLMEQGVDVVLGTNPNVLQPYGYLTDDSGHNMLIYYSLGNFVTGQETLKQLLGGMAAFTIQKTVEGDQTTVQVQNASMTPLVMHYSYDNQEYAPYKLSDYTDALASVHSVRDSIGDEFSLENLQTKYDEIMSMNVMPSTKTDLMDVTFDSDGNMMDSNGNYVEDNDSITSSWYYQNLDSQTSSDSSAGSDASDSEE